MSLLLSLVLSVSCGTAVAEVVVEVVVVVVSPSPQSRVRVLVIEPRPEESLVVAGQELSLAQLAVLDTLGEPVLIEPVSLLLVVWLEPLDSTDQDEERSRDFGR